MRLLISGKPFAEMLCRRYNANMKSSNRKDIRETLHAYGTLLQLLTHNFLEEDGGQLPTKNKLLRAVEAHQSAFTSLKRHLQEARSEWSNPHFQQVSEMYGEVVDSLTRLAQHLGGLRSGTNLRFELTRPVASETLASSQQPSGAADVTLSATDAFYELVDDVSPPMNALAVGNMLLSALSDELDLESF